MMNYMTDLTLVTADPEETTSLTIEGTIQFKNSSFIPKYLYTIDIYIKLVLIIQ